MRRHALLLVLGLAVAGCGRHHGKIISIANNEELAALANNGANAAAPAANAAANAQDGAASHDQNLHRDTAARPGR